MKSESISRMGVERDSFPKIEIQRSKTQILERQKIISYFTNLQNRYSKLKIY